MIFTPLNLKTSHVTVYHIMAWIQVLQNDYLKTSHVTVYRNENVSTKSLQKFKNISCYSLSMMENTRNMHW